MATILNRFLIVTVLLILFVIGGLSGLIATEITQSDKPFSHALWFLIPSIPIAAYYAHKATFGYKKKSPVWQNWLGIIALTVFFSLILLNSFRGYLLIVNGIFGRQQPFLLKGQIIRLDAPRRKGRLFSLYKIEVLIDSSQRRVQLNTKTSDYRVGQHFEEEMMVGSLGYIYSSK